MIAFAESTNSAVSVHEAHAGVEKYTKSHSGSLCELSPCPITDLSRSVPIDSETARGVENVAGRGCEAKLGCTCRPSSTPSVHPSSCSILFRSEERRVGKECRLRR